MAGVEVAEERETFVNQFLAHVVPPMFRIGCGDITDSTGRQTGQLDLVIEYPFVPSMPIINTRWRGIVP